MPSHPIDNIGVYHKNDPSHLLWTFRSIRAFTDHHDDLTIQKCEKVYKTQRSFNIPHLNNSTEYTYVICPIDEETYECFGRRQSLMNEFNHAVRTGEPLPEIDPNQRECLKCSAVHPLTDEFWRKSKGKYKSECKKCSQSYHRNHANERNARIKVTTKNELGDFFCEKCFETHDALLRHGINQNTCNFAQRLKDKNIDVSEVPRKTALGVYKHDDPDTIHYVYASRTEFLNDHKGDEHIGGHRFQDMWALNKYYNIPHADGLGSTYKLKPISDEEFLSWGRNDELHELVKVAVRNGTDIPTIEVSTTRTCKECGETKALKDTEFERMDRNFRSTCKKCRSGQKMEGFERKRKEREEEGIFFCKPCDQEHPYEERCLYGDICRKAHSANTKRRVDETKITREEAIEQGIVGNGCNDCGCEFDIKKFSWCQTRWKNQCYKCHTAKGYSERWRERQRELDEEAWKEYCRERSQSFRDANPEKMKEYYAKYAKDPMRRLKAIREQAEKRRIYFENKDFDQMLKLIGQDCEYCGRGSQDYLNGLDRLNNDSIIGYCINNVVPCCAMCNMAKRTQTPSEFVARMAKVVKNIDLTSFYNDEELYTVPNWKLFDVRQKDREYFTARKEGQSDKPNHEGQCYLCHYIGEVGWDRVDNNLSYQIEGNTQSCCTTCNFSKRDIDLRTFVDMATKITARYKGQWSLYREHTFQSHEETSSDDEDSAAPSNKARIITRPRFYGWKVYEVSGDEARVLVAKYPTTHELQRLTGKSANVLTKSTDVSKTMRFGSFDIVRLDKEEYLADNEVPVNSPIYQSSLDDAIINPRKKIRKRDNEGQIIVREPSQNSIVAVFDNITDMASELNVRYNAICKQVRKGELKGYWLVERGPSNTRVSNDQFISNYLKHKQSRGNQYSNSSDL